MSSFLLILSFASLIFGEIVISSLSVLPDVLDLQVTISNTGNEEITLLRTPESLLSLWRTDSFTITNEAGEQPIFNGVDVKYSLEKLYEIPENVLVLAPSEETTITHDIDGVYNFEKTGAGPYTITPSTAFTQVVKTDDDIEFLSIEATYTGEPVTFSLTGELNSGKRLAITGGIPEGPSISRRSSFVGCSSSRQNAINSAVTSAEQYVSDAIEYVYYLTR